MTKCVRAKEAARLPIAGLVVLAALWGGCGGGGGGGGDGGTCPTGQSLCSGVCTNTKLDPQHCGSCATACASGEVCASGACAVVCPPGLTSCGGGCTNTSYDPQHCGGCTTACDPGEVCADGTCAVACPPGLTDCGGACVNVNLDPQHCGNCITSCNTGETCSAGSCMLLCPPGQTNCSGTCTNTAIDPKHCGTCPNACGDGEVCVGGQCASFCSAGTTWCTDTCADLQRDKNHCGTCGTACTGTLGCHYGRCSRPRGDGIVDSWGELWDAFQRPAATWATAQAACQAEGGRLPTITELHRVNATTGTGELSDATATAPLWTMIAWDGAGATPIYAVVPLSTGAPAGQVATATIAYRCVWPDATDAFFGANACHGPPGATCTAAAGRTGYNFDAWERPPVTYLAASLECASLHARVPLQIELVEAITGSPALANGSNSFIWTSDQSRSDLVQLVRWTGSEPTTYTDVTPYVSWGPKTSTYRFRCLGAGKDTGTHPATITNEFVATSTRLKSESPDRTAATLHEAASTCFDAGGHLPLAHELVELVEAGLPGGSGTAIWIADAASYQYTEVYTWTGTKPLFAGLPAEAGWSVRGASTHPYRCAYLPVDAAYVAPATSVCNPACFLAEKGPIKLWADTFDRVQATYVDAVKGCVAVGAHLASGRDLLELIRAGLPNGSGAYVWTSDSCGGEILTNPEAYNLVVHWNGVVTGFDLTITAPNTYASHQIKSGGTTAPYRCVWSNEYR